MGKLDKKAKKFPRTVYKGHERGKLHLTTGKKRYHYDSMLVNDEEELKAAEELGYIDKFSAILEDTEVALEPEDEKGEEEF